MMATYFHGGSEIQAAAAAGDNLQTLYLMNPNYVAAYSEAHHHHNQTVPSNMLLLNPSIGSAPNALFPHPQQPSPPGQQLIGIPLPGSHSDNPSRPSSSLSLHARDHPSHLQIPASLHGLTVSRVHHNLWSPTVDPSSTHPSPIPTPTATGPQGLSLSLSPQQQNTTGRITTVGSGGDDGRAVAAGGSSASASNGVQGGGVILGSKYLKAAQELLDEVVSVIGELNKDGSNRDSGGARKEKAKGAAIEAAAGEGSSGGGGEGGTGSKRPAEHLSTAQRQELQMKKAKLLNMLDEVEQRYRQYHTQMQVVISSFEQAAGIGCAKSYTSLALQTISRQFRCLKDAIASQIKATSKSLGEEDNNGGLVGKLENGAGSRLRMVDHQLRQQRALQQLGMMQHNAWRPQRGLPERAVSVLRAWLFEHFLHPYPKDSDKHMLAKQTGLTRSQVSNWFINARVRLWKPMVEEMYLEEVKTQEQHNAATNSEENTTTTKTTPLSVTTKDQPTSIKPIPPNPDNNGSCGMLQSEHHRNTTNDMISSLSSMSTTTTSQPPSFNLIAASSSDMESLMARSPKKQRADLHHHHNNNNNSPSSILSMDMEMKPPDHHPRDHPPINSPQAFPNNPYFLHDMPRFNPDHHQLATGHSHGHGQGHFHGNGVSLTLGPPHCESLSLSGNHQQYNFISSQAMQLGRRVEIGASAEADFCGISMGQQPSHPSNAYDSIDLQSRAGFAAQLLHDFVA